MIGARAAVRTRHDDPRYQQTEITAHAGARSSRRRTSRSSSCAARRAAWSAGCSRSTIRSACGACFPPTCADGDVQLTNGKKETHDAQDDPAHPVAASRGRVLAGIGRTWLTPRSTFSRSGGRSGQRGKIRMVVNKADFAKQGATEGAYASPRRSPSPSGSATSPGRSREWPTSSRAGRQHQIGLCDDDGPRRRDRHHHRFESGEGASDHRLASARDRRRQPGSSRRPWPTTHRPATRVTSATRKARMSAARASGCSRAAKWPPAGIVVQRWML